MNQIVCNQHQLSLSMVCLEQICQNHYFCSNCQHPPQHLIKPVKELLDSINKKSDIRLQMEADIISLYYSIKDKINVHFTRLDAIVQGSLSHEANAICKLQQFSPLSETDVYHLQDILREEFNPFKQESIIESLKELYVSIETSFNRIRNNLSDKQLVQRQEFIFDKAFVYHDVNIIDNGKSIEDKLVMSISSKLGQALVQPSISKTPGNLVKIQFKLLKLGMSVNIGVAIDMNFTRYCSVNCKGQLYKKYITSNETKEESNFIMSQGDEITCVVDKSLTKLVILNENTKLSVEFDILVDQEMFFFLQILYSKVCIL